MGTIEILLQVGLFIDDKRTSCMLEYFGHLAMNRTNAATGRHGN